MKTAGIIAEYNPFHTGHEYQIQYVKKELGADYIIVAMSGDFVQRGTPALLSKYTRTKMALLGGADLVLELPVSVSTASAELFARGGVQLLEGLGVVDTLCFGSECGDTSILMELAQVLSLEPAAFKEALLLHLKEGHSFPKARSLALSSFLPNFKDIECILGSPNNILGIEYCKSIIREKSTITPVAIKRQGNAYHQTALSENSFPSALAIRKAVSETCDSSDFFENMMQKFIPLSCQDVFWQALLHNESLVENDLDLLYRYRLLMENKESLCSYLDLSPSLARRLLACRDQYISFSQFTVLLKTREVTLTRIQRALLHMLLQIRQVPKQIPYARVLGFRRESAPLLGQIKKEGTIPLLTKLSDAPSVLGQNPHALNLLKETTFASNLYQNIIAQKKNVACTHEYRQQIVLL